MLFSTVAVPFHIPPTVYQCLHFYQHLLFYAFKNISHFNRCEAITHCNFQLHFPNDLVMWSIFHVLIDHFCVFLEKCLLKFFTYFWMGYCFCCYCCWVLIILYIFWILIFYEYPYILNVFSHPVNCYFTLSFGAQKF